MNIIKKIEQLRFKRGWSHYQLAQESGITQSTLTSIIKRGNPPKIETLKNICDAFGITLSQFFLDDESLEVLTAEEKQLVAHFRNLSPEKQSALIDFLKR